MTKRPARKRRPLTPDQKYRRARTAAFKFLCSLNDDRFREFVRSVEMHRTTLAVYLPAIVEQINRGPRLMEMFK